MENLLVDIKQFVQSYDWSEEKTLKRESPSWTDAMKAEQSVIMKEIRAEKTWISHNMPHSEETKKKLSLAGMGNTNKKGKTGYKQSDEFVEKKRKWMLIEENNPMSNPDSVDKIRQKALIKHPCPKCGRKMNKGNLSRHVSICTK